MRELIEEGYYQENRTGINAYCLFAKSFNYKMIENEIDGVMTYRIPLLTTKKVFVKGIFEELMWFLSGSTDSTELEKKRVNIWKGNTRREYLDSIGLNNYKEGQTGPLYGFQFRHWGAEFNPEKNDYTGEGINQISNAINLLKTDPFSRRIIISTWNTSDLDKMCLNPCHVLYQFYVIEKNNKKYLNLILTQRSADVFLGLPYNIVSASLLLLIIAKEVDMIPYNMTHNIGNMHIYESHINAVKTQIKRDPFKFPYISIISKKKDLKYEFKDIKIHNYNHHSKITADMAV
jgi:thymidylate synthase